MFLIIPDLVEPCILGMSFLQETGCRIDIGRRIIELKEKADEAENAIPIMHMAVISREEDEEIMRSIDEKVKSIDLSLIHI